jgi:hypothetical protein
MLRRGISGFTLAIAIAYTAHAGADPVRLRVITEDASAIQCVDEVCTTVQVSRSTFSTGEVDTVLFVSAYDPFGEPIIPGAFTQIESSAFIIDQRGTHATLNHPTAVVTWEVTGDYTEESELTTKVVDKRPSALQGPRAFRIRERSIEPGPWPRASPASLLVSTLARSLPKEVSATHCL